jgi:hypothetical protein
LKTKGAKADIAGRAQAIGSGAFGGSRARLGAQEREEALRKAQLETAAGLRARGYESSAGRAQQAFESQQARQAQQAGLLGNLAGQQANIGSQMGTLGLGQQGAQLNQANALANLGSASRCHGCTNSWVRSKLSRYYRYCCWRSR